MADEPTGNPGTTSPGAVLEPGTFNWEGNIPQEYAGEKCLEPLKGQPFGHLVKGYVEAQKHIGKSVQLPSKDDDTEGWNKVWSRLGAKEKPEDYAYDGSKWEGKFEFDKDAMARFQKQAHEIRMPKPMYDKMMDWYLTEVTGKASAIEDQDRTNVAVLETKMKQEYGPNYEYNKGVALKGLYEYTKDSEAVETLHEVMKRNETVFRAFVKLGQELVEHRKIDGGKYEEFGAIDPTKAESEINATLADRTHAYHNPSNPGYAAAQLKMQELYKIRYPE